MKPDESRELSGNELVDLETVGQLAAEIDWTTAQLAEFYREGTERELNAIERALADGAVEQVRRRAHGAAGASATCGIEVMSRLLGRLEVAAEEGRLEDAADLLADGRQRLREVLSVLTSARD